MAALVTLHFANPILATRTAAQSCVSSLSAASSFSASLLSPASLGNKFCPSKSLQSFRPMTGAARCVATDVSPAVVSDCNPLLTEFAFPPFDKIEAKHVVPGIKQILDQLELELVELEASVGPSWERLAQPLEKVGDRLEVSWGAVQHLKAVKDSDELRKAVEEVQPATVELSLKMGQSRPLYQAFKALKEGDGWHTLTEAQKRIVDGEMIGAELSGVALEGSAKERFNAVQQELALLSTTFSNNLLDATKKWARLVTDPTEMDGLPPSARGLAAQTAVAKVSMAKKMATLESAEKLLEDLRESSWDAALKDLADLKAFAVEQGAEEGEDLKNWDTTFWSERLQEAKYNVTQEELRPYFSFPRVLEGLFSLVQNLFGIKVEAADGQAAVWHSDVRFFKVSEESGEALAFFYLDPYSRPEEKRGGAWMDSAIGRSRVLAPPGSSTRLPVAHMVCNQSPPIGEEPSLMTFREVETLFHEFGHALQHMLTAQEEGLVAGIRGVEWDAVELPSQFMENWCYHRTTLMGIAKHFETGEQLPEDLYQKLVAARTFRAASQMMRQIHFASLDLELHSRFQAGAGESVFDVDRRVGERTLVMAPLPEDRFLCGFSHLFAGGYAAGYYSYKWAEVLSADAFAAFEEAGLDNEQAVKETGRRFRDTVLGLGGGRAPLEVFKDFRGREPSTEPLLRHSGLLPQIAV